MKNALKRGFICGLKIAVPFSVKEGEMHAFLLHRKLQKFDLAV